MRVGNAKNVLSHEVSCALHVLADTNNAPELKTTSWFVGVIARWFQFMSNRGGVLALSYTKIDRYHDTVEFLQEVVQLFLEMRVGEKGDWKPFQTGIIISTVSAIELTSYLLEERNFKFVILGRFTQDCLENLFGVVRSKNCTVNALQFKYHLKSITVSQYMKPIPTGSYGEDDREFLPDFLSVLRNRNAVKRSESSPTSTVNNVPVMEETSIVFVKFELQSLYHFAGYIMHSIIENQSVCEECIGFTGSRTEKSLAYNKLTALKGFKKDVLFFVNIVTFDFFCTMEKRIRAHYDALRLQQNVNLRTFLYNKCIEIPFNVPACHGLKSKIVSRFVVAHLKLSSTTRRDKTATYGSKSMAMHCNVK